MLKDKIVLNGEVTVDPMNVADLALVQRENRKRLWLDRVEIQKYYRIAMYFTEFASFGSSYTFKQEFTSIEEAREFLDKIYSLIVSVQAAAEKKCTESEKSI